MKPITISIPSYQKDRLNGCAFFPGGTGAGSFTKWDTPQEVLNDLDEYLREDVEEAVENGETQCGYQFEDDEPVGWASTIDLTEVDGIELEERPLNRRSTALFVTDEHMLAPATNLVTIVYEVREREDDYLVLVHSMYPGHDVGELDGDVSLREEVAFFPWGHPGA